MTAIAFDTLSVYNKLTSNGFTKDQAGVLLETMKDVDTSRIATKQDITELKSDIKQAEMRSTIKMGGMLIALAAFLVGIKFFG